MALISSTWFKKKSVREGRAFIYPVSAFPIHIDFKHSKVGPRLRANSELSGVESRYKEYLDVSS
jgi:hypothetical protein